MADSRPVAMQQTQRYRFVLESFVISAVFIFLLCKFFNPRWETNDDVSISMVAHGYGVSEYGSPNLIFSNVIWGYLVRSIPTIHNILGYSLATLGVLFLVGAVFFYVLRIIGYGYIVSLSVLCLVFCRPVLFPQFTINSGLLMVTAIACWHLYSLKENWKLLVVGCVLAWLSYLIRSQEALLVFIVGLPLLPWRNLRLRRASKIAVAILVALIAISSTIDHEAYQGGEWKAFNEINLARAPYTDFGASARLQQRPDIFKRYGYSANDIALITGWSVYVDPKLADPKKLNAMFAELGPLPKQENALRSAWMGVKTLWHPNLLPIALTALLLFAARPNFRIIFVWVFCIAAVFVMGLLGRPGVVRVYVPLVCLLLLASFFHEKNSNFAKRLTIVLVLTAAIFNSYNVIAESRAVSVDESHVRSQFAGFPENAIVVWGDSFPFEATYPVLGATAAAMKYRIYGLGVFAPAPFSMVSAEREDGRGMVDLLLSKNGVPIIANDPAIKIIKIYCQERFFGNLKNLSTRQYGQIEVRNLQCAPKNLIQAVK